MRKQFEEECTTYDDPASYECEGRNVTRYKQIVSGMTETYRCKNHDYGNSFTESIKELGLVAGFVPILHKCNRLKTLIKGEKALVSENMRDTLVDMANYCIMMAMVIDEENDI